MSKFILQLIKSFFLFCYSNCTVYNNVFKCQVKKYAKLYADKLKSVFTNLLSRNTFFFQRKGKLFRRKPEDLLFFMATPLMNHQGQIYSFVTTVSRAL